MDTCPIHDHPVPAWGFCPYCARDAKRATDCYDDDALADIAEQQRVAGVEADG